jgi:radical SAM-linked protein
MCEGIDEDRKDAETTVAKSSLIERFKYVIAFRIEGDLKFISHHDTMRLFHRALARAAVPVRHSAGFNPHPCMTLPLPRPVGIASDAEYAVVECTEAVDEPETFQRLAEQMPAGLAIAGVRRLAPGEKLQPALVKYRLECSEGELTADLTDCVRQVMDAEVIPVVRIDPKKKTTRTIDARPYLRAMQVIDKNTVEFALAVTGSGSARPAEIAALTGCNEKTINHRIRRLEVQWH